MEINNQTSEKEQRLILENRKKLEVTGVIGVKNYNDSSVYLYTSLGSLSIRGKGLSMNRLNVDKGDIVIEGEMDSLTYINRASEGESLLKKLLK